MSQSLSSFLLCNLPHILVLLLFMFILILEFSHDLLSLIIFGFNLLQLIQFALDFVLVLFCLLQILTILTLDLSGLLLSILQGFFFELLFCF